MRMQYMGCRTTKNGTEKKYAYITYRYTTYVYQPVTGIAAANGNKHNECTRYLLFFGFGCSLFQFFFQFYGFISTGLIISCYSIRNGDFFERRYNDACQEKGTSRPKNKHKLSAYSLKWIERTDRVTSTTSYFPFLQLNLYRQFQLSNIK